MRIKFAIYDDFATRFTDSEAWEFIGGQWKELNLGDAHHKAKLMSEDDFKSVFPQLPPLPSNAFAPRVRRVV
jgi:hypothetical protein